jgi:hypothetical protein
MTTLSKRGVSLVAGLCLVAVAGVVAAEDPVDVSGDWSITWQGRQGERTLDAKFEQDGETLTGTVSGPQGRSMPLAGSVTGNAIEFTVTFQTQRGEFERTYKGEVEGDTMKGKAELPNGTPIDWSAKRE